MKYNGEYTKGISITQHKGGYVVLDTSLGGYEPIIVQSFESLCNELAIRFNLLEIGERVVLSATKERQEIK